LIQSASYLVCFGKREREKKKRKKERKSFKKSEKKRRERKKKCEEKRERKKTQNSDLSRLNLAPEFGFESVLLTVQ
jgi:sRNA-binding protein